MHKSPPSFCIIVPTYNNQLTIGDVVKNILKVTRGIKVKYRGSGKPDPNTVWKEMARVCWADDLETGLLMINYKDKWCSPAVEAFMDMMRRFVLTQQGYQKL